MNTGRRLSTAGELNTVGTVQAVCLSVSHSMSKSPAPSIQLFAGLGVQGDVHLGATVQHRSRVAQDPTQPNLRQLHLMMGELLGELQAGGFGVVAGSMGENVVTRDLDLLALPRGTRLHLGAEAVAEVTGLRNPCAQLDGLQPGLMAAVLGRDADGHVIRRAGIMAIIVNGGELRPGDSIRAELPPPPHLRLDRV